MSPEIGMVWLLHVAARIAAFRRNHNPSQADRAQLSPLDPATFKLSRYLQKDA
jgi:hypothetical protein